MFTLITGKYEVTLDNIPIANDWGIVDNLHKYDATHLTKERLSSLHSIKLSCNGVLLKSVLIGGYNGATGIHQTSQVIDQDKLVICCSNFVFCFSIPGLDLQWKTQADTITCFEIFKYANDYIVHGELEISRLNNEGYIIWQLSGADIFTTLEGKDDFIITEDFIFATDFNGKKYKFDFNGKAVVSTK